MTMRAFLFDFDGTLSDSFAAITHSVNHVRQLHHQTMLTEAEVRQHVGHGLKQLLQVLVPQADVDQAVEQYRAHHEKTMMQGTKLFPGVFETVQELAERGFSLAICSNKAVAFTKKLVQELGLAEYIKEVLGPEDAEAPKPHPSMLWNACQRLQIDPKQAIFVGDMIVDVRTAQAAGIRVWLVRGGVNEQAEAEAIAGQPDLVLATFAELLHHVPPTEPGTAPLLS